MECLKCNNSIDAEANFCPYCGSWTSKGYTFLKNKDNLNSIKGKANKEYSKLGTLCFLLIIGVIVFIACMLVKGMDIFNPYIVLKKYILSYSYGYKVSLIKTNNIYEKVNVNDKTDALSFIEKDYSTQNFLCNKDADIIYIENNISNRLGINVVSLCDVSLEEAKKIEIVFNKIYNIFPNIKNYLTNINITNAETKEEYIARFDPYYEFVNSNQSINEYNKVSKAQILLNSYYFLNNDILNKSINDVLGKEYYVKDATWESIISHELGHLVSYVALLKEKNISDTVFITKNNYESIENIINIINSGSFSKTMVLTAFNNYKEKNNSKISINDYAKNISIYASELNNNNELIYDEIIAEAVHDYYLHGYNSTKESIEIIKVLKGKLKK